MEGKADSVTCVYNSVDGVPRSANTNLLQKHLRELCRFKRTHLRPAESAEVRFAVEAGALPQGKVSVSVGGGQPLAEIPYVEGAL